MHRTSGTPSSSDPPLRVWAGAITASLRIAHPPASAGHTPRPLPSLAKLLLNRVRDPRTEKVRDFGERALWCELVPQPRRVEVQEAVEALGAQCYSAYPFLDGAPQPKEDSLYQYAAGTSTLGSRTVREEVALNRTWRPAVEVAGLPQPGEQPQPPGL